MTSEPVTMEALLATRDRLFQELPAALDANEREFLRTLVQAKPTWALLGIPHLEELTGDSVEASESAATATR